MASADIVFDNEAASVSEAARIWAEATAARDGDPDIAALSLSLPIIERVINSSPGSIVGMDTSVAARSWTSSCVDSNRGQP